MHARSILTILTAYLTAASIALPTKLAERAKGPYVAVALTINIKEPGRPIYFEPSPAEVRMTSCQPKLSLYVQSASKPR